MKRIALFFQIILGLVWVQVAMAWPIETRFGILDEIPVYFDPEETHSTARDYSNTRLSLSDREIKGVVGWFEVAQVFNWAEKGDVVLLAMWSGGASCCHSYRLLHITESGATLTARFGDHGTDPSEFTVTTDSISFRLERNYPADVDHLRAYFDGTEISIETVMEDDTNVSPAGANDDVLRWVGQYPFVLFEAAGERVRFRQIMINEELNQLRASFYLGNKLITSDGYLFSSGCIKHRCDSHFGYIAIEIATGRPFAAYWNEGKLSVFGSTEEMLPRPLLDAIKANHEKVRAHCKSTPFPERYERCHKN